MQLASPNTGSTVDNCRYCLMCRHVCPVGHVTHLETLTPHGWALTIASVERGLLTWNEESVAALYHCADCGTCQAHCVTDQPLPDAIASTRAAVMAQGLAPAAAVATGQMLATWGNPYEKQTPAAAGSPAEVALFVGDDVRYRWPAALVSALELLDATGVKPSLIGAGRNNGYLASSLGLPDLARDLARANLAELAASGATTLLVLAPGDFYAFTRLYPERLGVAFPPQVRIREVTSLLAESLARGTLTLQRGGIGGPYAYLDPTHTVRVPGRTDAPRRLLAAVLGDDGRELFWRRERAHPSGATALQFTLPHLAHMLAAARLADAQRAGADRVVTEDAADLALLSGVAAGSGVRVQGLFELLVDHMA